jgi:hypothetical protein
VGVYAGPEITSDGLVLALDAGNSKGFDDDENLLAYSEDFSNPYWAKSNVSITSNAITSPTGSSNASKLVESASTAVHELNRAADPVLSSGIDNYITFSIFAKAAERQYCYIRATGNTKRIAVVVDLSNGTFNVTNWGFTLNSSATVTAYPNGWYRITATAQSNYPPAPGWFGAFYVSPLDSYQSAGNVGGSGYSYAGNGTSGIYIWGAHYEFGPGISNYYPTTGTIKNRGTTLIDLTGRGNSGTLTNGPTYSSSSGGSIVFDGTNDWVSCSSNPSYNVGTGDFSVFCWMKSSNKSNYQTIMTLDDAATGNGILFYANTNDGVLRTWIGGSVRNGTIDICNNTWNFVGVTRISGTVTHYINSISNGTYVASGSVIANQNLRLGSYDGSGYMFNGNIAQVSIYNRALTVAEIQQNYNATRGRYGI